MDDEHVFMRSRFLWRYRLGFFPLSDIASAQEVPFDVPQRILHGLASFLLCVPFIFVLTVKSVDLVVARMAV